MFNWNKAIDKALLTWYPVDHYLHLNPHHPLMKIIGEWGELLDDYAKLTYKPNYEFKPIDELGDIWYYDRILTNIYDLKLVYIDEITIPELDVIINIHDDGIDTLIDAAIYILSAQFLLMKNCKPFNIRLPLYFSYSVIVEICRRYNITLQQLTDSNWQKLKLGSEYGNQWMKAYVNIGKIGKVE